MKISRRIKILLRFYKAKGNYFKKEDLDVYKPSTVVEDARKDLEKEIAIYKKKVNKVQLNTKATRREIFLELERY